MAGQLRIRPAGRSDAESVATLHADSWRRHYRGVYADEYLDGDVVADRLTVWTERLATPDPDTVTLIAEDDDEPLGFVHVELDSDATWGSLVDNLHVAARNRGGGIGTRLLTEAARPVVERGTALYLWVLERNADARAFYRARGGTIVERQVIAPLSEDPKRYVGEPVKLRCAWPDPRVLLGQP